MSRSLKIGAMQDSVFKTYPLSGKALVLVFGKDDDYFITSVDPPRTHGECLREQFAEEILCIGHLPVHEVLLVGEHPRVSPRYTGDCNVDRP